MYELWSPYDSLKCACLFPNLLVLSYDIDEPSGKRLLSASVAILLLCVSFSSWPCTHAYVHSLHRIVLTMSHECKGCCVLITIFSTLFFHLLNFDFDLIFDYILCECVCVCACIWIKRLTANKAVYHTHICCCTHIIA